ncbi:DUF4430 domain-containing protein [Paenibacillus sp. IITD108]|uniref:DUF4430 domain-containing protein n=1 Tax=Paenibacillus sp. IITD108 TaxID=3116649 RepID=UPI002F40C98F
MNKKKWLTGLAIVCVLAIAFFWGGNFQKQSVKTDNNVGQLTHNSSLEQTGEAGSATDELENNQEKHLESNPEVQSEAQSNEGLKDDGEAPVDQSSTSSTIIPEPDKQPEPETKPIVPTPAATAANGSNQAAEASNNSEKAPASTPAPIETKEPNDKDKYLTDPVLPGKPEPVEWQDTKIDKQKELTVTLSVSAATILDNLNIFDADKLEVLPQDGIIYAAKKVVFYEGESVFDVLLRELKANKIHMEFNRTPLYNSNYIEGINNIYEFDCGELSGWIYKVNGWFPNYGSSRYALQDGDVVEWVYTCDLGRDVGGYVAAAGESK